MGNRSLIGSVLIVCGTLCILAAVAAAVFVAYHQMQVQAQGPPIVSVPRVETPGWAVAIMFFGVVVGIGMVIAGVSVGIRSPKAP